MDHKDPSSARVWQGCEGFALAGTTVLRRIDRPADSPTHQAQAGRNAIRTSTQSVGPAAPNPKRGLGNLFRRRLAEPTSPWPELSLKPSAA